MDQPRRLAFWAGALYLLTVVTSIPALALKAPVLEDVLVDPASLARDGARSALMWASLLEVVLALACIGTAIALYPIARRGGEVLALGFIASRTLEAGIVILGVVSMLTLLDVPRDAGLEPALVAMHDWAFLIGPGLIPAVNGLLLGTALYRLRAVPRILPILAFIGAPLLAASAIMTIFGISGQVSTVAGLLALPIAAWEIGLGIWLVVRGVRLEAAEA